MERQDKPKSTLDEVLKKVIGDMMEKDVGTRDPREAALRSYEKATKSSLEPQIQSGLQRIALTGVTNIKDVELSMGVLQWAAGHFILLKNGAIKVQLVRKDAKPTS